jgi:hypothetical protein
VPARQREGSMQLTKRRLTDLWVTGRELSLDDGSGEAVVVWIQKLNPVDAAETNRRCDAVRATVLAMRHDHDSTGYQAVRASVLDFGDDADRIADILLGEDRARTTTATEARLANEEEWSKDNYLQGLRDAWQDGLEKRWLTDKSDVEAVRVYDEMHRFASLVADTVDAEIAVLREVMMARPLSELQDRLVDKLLEVDANQSWIEELRRCEIYYGTREPEDHKKRYFTERAEVDQLSPMAYQRLRTAYEDLEVDVMEGKDSPAPLASSPSSEPPNEEETATSSGLVSVGP